MFRHQALSCQNNSISLHSSLPLSLESPQDARWSLGTICLCCAVFLTWNAVASFSTFSYCACSLRLSSKCHPLLRPPKFPSLPSDPEHKTPFISFSLKEQLFAHDTLLIHPGFLCTKTCNKIFFDPFRLGWNKDWSWSNTSFSALSWTKCEQRWVTDWTGKKQRRKRHKILSGKKKKKDIVGMNCVPEDKLAILYPLTTLTLKITLYVRYHYTANCWTTEGRVGFRGTHYPISGKSTFILTCWLSTHVHIPSTHRFLPTCKLLLTCRFPLICKLHICGFNQPWMILYLLLK